ncbi:DNA cross-link repair 1A protein [Tritrichomonas musculus]|uniref:DNA cross-link repair 1A protein n=1 Tax=Tritrichomonas musculus TaxID=1915356 RepID=A0ABR2IK03_9EUKA
MSTPPKRGAPRKPPLQFSVPGTNFTVDWHCKTFPNYIHSFLSHAHEDHMAGIRSFKPPRVLHCTEITAKMLLIKVPKIKPCIKICNPNTSFTVEGVKIYVLDANHTPGSAMFIFELKSGKKILHTGDFRAEEFVINSITSFSPIDHLFIDCTYACQGINFPKRSECVSFVIETIHDLFPKGFFAIIGTYSIGKESLIFDVAQATASTIYAPEPRMTTLRDLTSTGWHKSKLLNDDKCSAQIHVLSIGNGATLETSIEYAKSLNKTKVVVFSLSGWNGRAFWQTPRTLEAENIKSILYDVPYSDHSSPEELIQFVKAVSPSKITPTTAMQPKLINKINKMFHPFIRKSANKQYIDFYFSPTNKNSSCSQQVSEDPSISDSQPSIVSQTDSHFDSNSFFSQNSQLFNPSSTDFLNFDDSQCFLQQLNEIISNNENVSTKPTPVRVDDDSINHDNMNCHQIPKKHFLSSDSENCYDI